MVFGERSLLQKHALLIIHQKHRKRPMKQTLPVHHRFPRLPDRPVTRIYENELFRHGRIRSQ
jgi:hypothetical protein